MLGFEVTWRMRRSWCGFYAIRWKSLRHLKEEIIRCAEKQVHHTFLACYFKISAASETAFTPLQNQECRAEVWKEAGFELLPLVLFFRSLQITFASLGIFLLSKSVCCYFLFYDSLPFSMTAGGSLSRLAVQGRYEHFYF